LDDFKTREMVLGRPGGERESMVDVIGSACRGMDSEKAKLEVGGYVAFLKP